MVHRPPIISSVLVDTELDLVQPLQAASLVQPTHNSAVRLQAYIVDAFATSNVSKPYAQLRSGTSPLIPVDASKMILFILIAIGSSCKGIETESGPLQNPVGDHPGRDGSRT